MEKLDRGLAAVVTDEGVFLSWRLQSSEAWAANSSGLVGKNFEVLRDGIKIATVTDSTNYLDREGQPASAYEVRPLGSPNAPPSETVSPWDKPYGELPLTKPADGITPKGTPYTYTANDMSVGDVDGDGELEYVVKWEPSNSKDVSQVGYTGTVYLDTYELDGTLLHRLDLGVNIRAGAHYTQFLVYDFDGDGRAEIMLKTAPGTKSVPYSQGLPGTPDYITMPGEDVDAGYSHQDDYRMSAADYYEHIVDTFQGWHAHPEVVSGQWPKTLEEAFGIEPRHQYPLSDADARSLADYFMDVYAPKRNSANKLRAFEGYILSGPEYLTVFEGATGRELQTARYEPGRTDDGLLWGDYATPRIEPGNRVDRFLSGVAYLDGSKPSAIFARGYYSRSAIVAYDWDGEKLTTRWTVDSGWATMANPFLRGGRDGSNSEFATLTTQGFHSLSAADVDNDGRQEIVYGAATIDDDGSLLYSSFADLPPGSGSPGTNIRFGHGDAMHVADIDPDRDGLEIFTVHESGNYAPYGMVMRQAEDGKVIFGAYSGQDTGRGMVGDVDPGSPGLESWANMPSRSGATGLHSPTGERLTETAPGLNQSIRWAADMTTQMINGSTTEKIVTPTIDDWTRGTLVTAEGAAVNNWTKGNPGLVADVLGDWREEMLVRTADSSAIRIYLSTEVTDRKLYTLLHDPQYRAEVARQQTTYNQPSHPSFYLGSDIDWSQVPLHTRKESTTGVAR